MYSKFNYAGGPHGCGPAFAHGRRQHFMGGGFYRRPKHNVPVNIVETDTHYVVHVYALSFAKEDIKVTATGDVLYITGTRTIDENNKPNFIRQEYPIKSFERVLDLNGVVDTTNITATHTDGVLHITLPKTPEAQKSDREININ